ncbi:CYCLOPS-like protein isoform X2, partial [Tanacetum coccineum]
QSNPGQSQNVYGSPKKLVANGTCRENKSVAKGTGDREDHAKNRRVERMTEAKEKTQTPATSLDIHSILSRCENLEKEVRSLKLNLAFMERVVAFFFFIQVREANLYGSGRIFH